jgi:hypothetical protein
MLVSKTMTFVLTGVALAVGPPCCCSAPFSPAA